MKNLAVLLVFVLFLSACSGSDDSADDSGVAAAAEVVPGATGAITETEERDCVRSTEPDAADIAKPAVGDEYLGNVDELIVTDLVVGDGAVAQAGDAVTMQYVGVLAEDGTEFDASWDRGAQPFRFDLGSGQVIAGWDEGIEGMKVGGRRVLQIPSDKAYGDTPPRGDVIGADADLVFIVDLVGVAESVPSVPEDVLGSFDELGIVDLVEGTGCEARYGDIVSVHYVGVDAVDGVEFDSSWSRNQKFRITVGRSSVIDGWNDGIEGMKVGGERILQIPSSMAYDEGDLVFRVHLEQVVDAPLAHTITFDGPAPDEIQVTTLVEGSGPKATPTSTLSTHIAIIIHQTNMIAQSTWESGSEAEIALVGGTPIQGLVENIEGIQAGEVRQIIVPAPDAYPDGIPPESGLTDDDALVFIVAPSAIGE